MVPSPGVPPARYRARARRVWGDIELAYRALAVPIVAVTGTNGKSTTVRLLEAMLRAAGLRARAAGNVGRRRRSAWSASRSTSRCSRSRRSSSRRSRRFRPRVAVLLNVTPDHLDRHGDLAGYLAAKARIFENQAADDIAIVNAEPAFDALCAGLRARVLRFSARGAVERGACWDGEAVCLRAAGVPLRIQLDGLPRPSGPLRENVLAALLAVVALGAEPAKALAALATSSRCRTAPSWWRERAGVAWVNDSKATNPGATVPALALETRPVIWIAGGKDKGLDYAELAGGPARGRAPRAPDRRRGGAHRGGARRARRASRRWARSRRPSRAPPSWRGRATSSCCRRRARASTSSATSSTAASASASWSVRSMPGAHDEASSPGLAEAAPQAGAEGARAQ